ncbi:Uma2 family endonuclease [Pseudanabaena sp. PCC 6802]|uniref:Uma2 family endonuclease n=1 Tax=Pseudanabaena sp. PCC 6802 TaxID=118173 RepID=UPI0003486268|nr:Uma2 family endonuclease [Pseudanabaena sp. PCC 6802]
MLAIDLAASPKIAWEKLPDDFVLPDNPVDNINQPLLASALTDSLAIAGRLSETTLTPTNYAICATLDGQYVAKAPDWAFIPEIRVSRQEIDRSYTPNLQGDMPAIVMEFLSDADGSEYSTKPTYPPGKWFFYEEILQVPYYVIFNPSNGILEVYRLDESGRYRLQTAAENGRFQIESLKLFLGVWQGTRDSRTGYWLRWWDEESNLLLWRSELVEEERQRAEQEYQRAEREYQRAEQERQRAEQAEAEVAELRQRLREAGIE